MNRLQIEKLEKFVLRLIADLERGENSWAGNCGTVEEVEQFKKSNAQRTKRLKKKLNELLQDTTVHSDHAQ